MPPTSTSTSTSPSFPTKPTDRQHIEVCLSFFDMFELLLFSS